MLELNATPSSTPPLIGGLPAQTTIPASLVPTLSGLLDTHPPSDPSLPAGPTLPSGSTPILVQTLVTKTSSTVTALDFAAWLGAHEFVEYALYSN
ncbi:hypothetical protein C0995_001794 [Termitomyces sp. Mi166|nr:hypothetical protein C0995_001794 [Termitomyces sp. Mi166\